jgi:hypothetical protein
VAIKSQADQRRNQIMTDQHGRRWFAVIEKASGYPTGKVLPQFRVPHRQLVPPTKYLEFQADDPAHVRIKYDEWIRDMEAANRVWDQDRIRLGRLVHGSAFDPNGPTPMELLILLGPRPLSPLPIVAMKQENRWCLGFTDKRPPEADRFFPKPEALPASLAFTETDPVFTEEKAAAPAASSPRTELVNLIAGIEGRVPANLHGAARSNWILGEIRKLTEGVPPAALDAAPQPQEA